MIVSFIQLHAPCTSPSPDECAVSVRSLQADTAGVPSHRATCSCLQDAVLLLIHPAVLTLLIQNATAQAISGRCQTNQPEWQHQGPMLGPGHRGPTAGPSTHAVCSPECSRASSAAPAVSDPAALSTRAAGARYAAAAAAVWGLQHSISPAAFATCATSSTVLLCVHDDMCVLCLCFCLDVWIMDVLSCAVTLLLLLHSFHLGGLGRCCGGLQP